jgi:raffinose/stachyose/melibiose transport system permease protein
MDSSGVGMNRNNLRRMLLLFFFLGPAVLVYSIFSVYPLIATMSLSTFSSDSSGALHFAGLDNYRLLLMDKDWREPFWNAFLNNIWFFIIHMAVQNPIGIAIAGLLSLPHLKFRGTYRTLIFTPTMLSVVIIGFSWNLILSPLWGISEGFLKFFGLGALFKPWLGLESSALITIGLISVWQFVGIPLMLIYAALLNVPSELVDAARIDGLSHMRIFFSVKLPLIAPTIGLVSILTFVSSIRSRVRWLVRISQRIFWEHFSIAPFLAINCNWEAPQWALPLRPQCF